MDSAPEAVRIVDGAIGHSLRKCDDGDFMVLQFKVK